MNMQTGFGDAGDRMAEQYIETMTNILLPVFEKRYPTRSRILQGLWERHVTLRRHGICDEILCYERSW